MIKNGKAWIKMNKKWLKMIKSIKINKNEKIWIKNEK